VSRILVMSALAGWVGLTLLLSELRWFSRVPLSERLRPYAPGGAGGRTRAGLLSVESFRDVVAPAAAAIGERLARFVGVVERVDRRLERTHSPLDATTFRVRQAGWASAGLGAGAIVALAIQPPLPLAGLFTLVPPALGFLVPEQQLASASARWQRRVTLELPVVTEQLATLLGAGWSLGAAIGRLADRGSGACAADLARVRTRIQQGLSEDQALREWADLVRVEAVDRLVPVLALNREATDLGRLLAEEARNIRRERHRDLLATIERRSEQVWIPVTVATLVPGVIFLAVPFIEALRLYSGS
jgi:tight adherence protein C